VLEARLACAEAFDVIRLPVVDRGVVDELVRGAEKALRLHERRDDADAQSEALDALGALYRSGYGDSVKAMEFARRRLAIADRLTILERLDAWNVLAWDLTYVGRYEEAIDAYSELRRSLRPGEPDYLLCHAAAWAGYAAVLIGRWDDAEAFGDALVAWREEAPDTVKRFTAQGWLAALRVARARLDTTRLARLQNAFAAVADVDQLAPGTMLWNFYRGMLELDRDALHACLRDPSGRPDGKAETISLLVLELGDTVPESEIVTTERRALSNPPLLTLRLQLARALNGGNAGLRAAIDALDDGHIVADAARATALLALRTHDPGDRADAERRLTLLGDRAFLQKLAEEW
jgi:tetratricopeptide (TPR) repeat protein